MCSPSSPGAVVEQVLAGADGLDVEILALIDLAGHIEAALVERVGTFDAAEGYKDDGAYSLACWLRARVDMSRTESLQLTRFASTLRTMPRFDDHEAFLVDHIQGLDIDAAKAVLAHWKRLADTDGPDPSDPNRNRASLTTGWDGRWHLDADFDPASGALIKAALDAIEDRMHQDGRFNDLGPDNTSSRRHADAFVEMAQRATGRNPDQPAVHPDIVVLVPYDQLLNPEPDPFAAHPELIGTGPISWNDVFRLALLGTISTLTLDPDGRPLNLGRKQRLATSDQWIALRVRDRGCVAPGCDRPAEWCQAHHLRFWDRDGGPTDLTNLCLACKYHHHLIHDQHWTLHQHPDGTWQLTRPDGTTVDPPRYPGNQRPPPKPRQPH